MTSGDRNKKSDSTGFTLVEVMVALLVLALVMTALQFQITQHVNNSAYLRDKAVAAWVAQNQLELARLESRLHNRVVTEPRRGTVAMAGKRWAWTMSPDFQGLIPDEESRIVPINITVAEMSNPESPLITLEGLTDAWHRLQ